MSFSSVLPSFFLLTLVVCLIGTKAAYGWGGDGHRYVALLAVKNLPDSPFKAVLSKNADWFAVASSYPDRWRNRPDASEAPRHFLDGENFGSGTNLMPIPRSFADVQKIRTYRQLRTDGMVPWTVGRHYDLLVIALREKRMDDALMQAAYLSHYIGDSHVPFHASANYDGQLSQPSQKGIHSRFESQMLERSVKWDDLKTGQPLLVNDPIAFTFDTLQTSINEVAGILTADKEAVTVSGGEYNDTYWNTFTPKARPVAITRLETGGRALAGLLQKAWEEAGKPQLPTDFMASNRLFPYAPEFTPRGQPQPAFLPAVTEEQVTAAREKVKAIELRLTPVAGRPFCHVYLPADYETSNKRYPVLYLLAGVSGDPDTWRNDTNLAGYVANRPFLVVVVSGPAYFSYLSKEGGSDWDYLVTRLLIPTIDRQYRTEARPEKRFIGGRGPLRGQDAWLFATTYPKLFGGAIALKDDTLFSEATGATLNARLRKALESGRKKNAWTRAGSTRYPALYFADTLPKESPADAPLTPNQQMEKFLLERRIPYQYAEYVPRRDELPTKDGDLLDMLQFVERGTTGP